MKKGEAFKESDEIMCQERMFSLKDIKTQTQLEKVDEGEMLSDVEKDGGDAEVDKDTEGDGEDDKESDMEDEDDDDDDDVEGGEEDHPESEEPEDTEDGMGASSSETGMCTNLYALMCRHLNINFKIVPFSQPSHCVTEQRVCSCDEDQA